MGILRKAASVSTLGLVNYRSNGERKAKAVVTAARAEARLANEQAKAVRQTRKAEQ